jgi:sulfur carrier protein ThiS
MPATLILVGPLKDYTGGRLKITIAEACTVRDALGEQNIPPEIVALVTVNGVQQAKDYVIVDGDVVKAIAVLGGG